MSATIELRSSRTAVVLLAAAILSVVGCGPADSSRSREAVAETVSTFLAAVAAGDRETVADLAPRIPSDDVLDPRLREALSQRSFMVDPEQVTIEGRRATAIVQFPESPDMQIQVPLSWTDGSWTVSDSMSAVQHIDVVRLIDNSN